MRLLPRFAVIALSSVVVVSPAAGATIHLQQQCFRSNQLVSFDFLGSVPNTPSTEIEVHAQTRFGDSTVGEIGTGPSGDWVGASVFSFDLTNPAQLTETLYTNDATNPANDATASFIVSRITASRKRGKLSGSTTFSGTGMIDSAGANAIVYAHYVDGNSQGRVVRRVALGLAHGCGDFRRRAPLFPFRPVKAGPWTIWFTPGTALDRGTPGAWAQMDVYVPKRIR